MTKKNTTNNKDNLSFSSFSENDFSQKDSLQLDVKKWLSLQYKNINQNIEKTISSHVISQIHDYVLNHEPFDSGTEGVVYKVPVETEVWLSYFLVAKKRYNHDVSQEYKNHKYLSTILHTSNEFVHYIDIPKLYGKFDDATNNESYIIMDYIQGKTFFAILVEKISWTVVENDKDAQRVLNDMFLQKKWYSTSQFSDLVDFLKKYIQDRGIKLFSFQEGMTIKYALKNFINHIHQQWFYHRDMWNNLRNIIIWDDKKIYIIDFWCSVILDKNIKNLDPDDIKEIYYYSHKNNIPHYYAYDESFLDTIDMLTNKPPKKDPRELSY